MPIMKTPSLFALAPRIRRMVLCALVVGVPVLFLRGGHDPFNTPKLTLLMIGLAFVSFLRIAELLQGGTWTRLGRLLVPAGALALPLVISWLLSPYRGWALFGLVGRYQGLVPYLLVILLGILIADAFAQNLEDLAFAFVWGGVVVAGYSIVQSVGADPFAWSLGGGQTAGISTLGNPNFTGGFLGMVIPVGGALYLTAPDRRRTLIRLMIIVLAGWLITRSQGGWAAGVAGGAVVGGVVSSKRWRLARVAGLAAAGLIAIAIIGAVVYSTASPEARFASSTFEVRGRWWSAAVGMGMDSPLIGRGPNSFAIDGVGYRSLADALAFNFDFPDDPHSVPLSFFANAGLLGLAGFLFVFAWALWRSSFQQERDLLVIGFFGAVVAYLIQSLVSIDEVSLRASLWVALAGITATQVAPPARSARKTKSPPRKGRSPSTQPLRRIPAIAVVGVIAIGAIAWSFMFLRSNFKVSEGARLIVSERAVAGKAVFDDVHGFREDAAYEAIEALNFKRVALQLGLEGEIYRDLAIKAFDSYVGEVPFLHGIVEYARLLDDWGEEEGRDDDEGAEKLFSRALDIDPLNPVIRAELAQVLLEKDQFEEASEVMEQASGQEVLQAEFWGTLALVRVELGQEAEAKAALEKALSIDSAESTALRAKEILERSDGNT